MADDDDRIRRLSQRIEALETSHARTWPVVASLLLLFVPVFSVALSENEIVDGASDSALLPRLIIDPSVDGRMGVVIAVVAALVCAGLAASVIATVGRLSDPGHNRVASIAAAVALVAALALYVLTVPNDGSGNLGNDIYQPTWTYVLVIGIAAWLGAVNSADTARSGLSRWHE